MYSKLFCLKFFVLSLGISPAVSFATTSDMAEFPEFKVGTVWQSVVISKMGELSFPGVSKKWVVRKLSDGSLALVERTQLSTGVDSSGQSTAVSRTVVLGPTYSCGDFTNMPFPVTSSMRRLSSGRFGLTFDSGFKFEVVLVPSVAKKEPRKHRKSIGVIEAPFDPSITGTLPPTYSNGFLHQTNQKDVLVDPSVPSRFSKSISSALLKWNSATGRKVYKAPVRRKMTDEDCISTRTLCIKWQGPTDSLSWIGWGGITSMSFDPEDGSLIGGLIILQNLRNSEQRLQETPKDITDAYLTDQLSSKIFSALMLRKEEFKTYRHPFESALVESTFLHELGHANGLKHDFSASLEADSRQLTSSIMDYPPFPVAFLIRDLQSRDRRRLAAVYDGRDYYDYDGCSDEMEKSGREINCSKGDFGHPEQWYSDIVMQSPLGVFETVVEYISGLPEREYLSLFAKFFSGNLTEEFQREFARTFLCSQQDVGKIKQSLKNAFGVELSCP